MTPARLLLTVSLGFGSVGCFGPAVIDAPTPPAGARSMLLTRRQPTTDTITVEWRDLEAESPDHSWVQSTASPNEVWIDYLETTPGEWGLEPGAVELTTFETCGARRLPHAETAYKLDLGSGRFVPETTRSRPELARAGRCLCPAPKVTRLDIGRHCELEPASLTDDSVLLAYIDRPSCDFPGPNILGLQTLDLETLSLSRSTSISAYLQAHLQQREGVVDWGTGDLDRRSPTEIFRYSESGEFRRLASAPPIGRTAAFAIERTGESALFITETSSPARRRSELFRLRTEDGTIEPVPLPGEDPAEKSQDDTLVRVGEADVLVFLDNSGTWFRVRNGVVDEGLEPFPGVGGVIGGVHHPELGTLVSTRNSQLLRLEGDVFVPIDFEVPGGRQRMYNPFVWGGSLGFLTVDGGLGQYRPDETQCPMVEVRSNLLNVRVAVAGNRAVIAGFARETEEVALWLLEPSN